MLHKLICALALALATQLSFVAPASAGVNINTAPWTSSLPCRASVRESPGHRRLPQGERSVQVGRRPEERERHRAKRLEKLRNDVSVGGPPARVAVAAGGKPEAKGAGPSAKGDVRGSAEAKPAK